MYSVLKRKVIHEVSELTAGGWALKAWYRHRFHN